MPYERKMVLLRLTIEEKLLTLTSYLLDFARDSDVIEVKGEKGEISFLWENKLIGLYSLKGGRYFSSWLVVTTLWWKVFLIFFWERRSVKLDWASQLENTLQKKPDFQQNFTYSLEEKGLKLCWNCYEKERLIWSDELQKKEHLILKRIIKGHCSEGRILASNKGELIPLKLMPL